jgi:hypothetical protein
MQSNGTAIRPSSKVKRKDERRQAELQGDGETALALLEAVEMRLIKTIDARCKAISLTVLYPQRTEASFGSNLYKDQSR